MFKDHVEVPGLDKEKSKLDDLINQMRYFKDFIKKLNRMDVTSNRSQHQIKNGDIVRVFNKRGQVLAGAVVTEAVMQGVVRMQEGAWYDPAEPGKAGTLCRHGDVNVLIPDVGTSELAQGNQATALVEIEKFKGEVPEIGIFKAPKIKGV